MSYNFKTIPMIPLANDLINIMLSKTQRKTPTVVHPGYAVSRIRSFYMRKVKFCQENIAQKLALILDNFPKLDDIHPFYGDLFNVLYDKDHYKLALGHVKATKNMIENMSKDYLKLLKYGDSLYRCKSLKRAALGRMCTMLRKISSSLAYLEEVRKHLARLPSINPYDRTILLTGYPNVGKSSFINTISKANVEVQPYPFTTKALYVGHTDYSNLRFQVIDSPGVLDHNLQEMNTIEMQSITALAHLKSCVLYFVDASEQCNYSIFQQIHLYNTIKPLFKNKPIIIVFNKADIRQLSQLSKEKATAVNSWLTQNNLKYIQISALKQLGVQQCKKMACQIIMDLKMQSKKNQQQNFNGLYVAMPKKRDKIERTPVIVDRSVVNNRPNIKKLEEENGGAGVFTIPLQQHYIIPEEWRYDLVPQIYNGKNIADFVDADIWNKIQELEKEEQLMLDLQNLKIQDQTKQQQLSHEYQQAYQQIQRKRHVFRLQHSLKKGKTAYLKNKSMEQFKKTMQAKDIDTSLVEERMRNRSKSRSLKSLKMPNKSGMINEDEKEVQQIRERIREASRSRSKGYRKQLTVQDIRGQRDVRKLSQKWRTMDKKGQSDRFIGSAKPKHLYTGKSGKGSKDWR